jgi:diguanylate cyclase (GGDEF)-like protein
VGITGQDMRSTSDIAGGTVQCQRLRRGWSMRQLAALSRWACCLVLALSGVRSELEAATTTWVGQPSVTRFTPADTDANPYSFAVLPLASGEVFVGNSDGLLRYFGQHWQHIELPGSGAARSLALGADGRIYVGGYQHFGVLKRAVDGRYSFDSLERLFFPDAVGAPLGEIWDTIAVPEGVYFATSKQLFLVGYDGRRATIDLPGVLLGLFDPGGEPVVALRDRRLFKLSGTELLPWFKAGGRVRALVRTAPEHYWMLTDKGRMFAIDGATVEPQSYAGQSLLETASPYSMTRLPGGDYAIGTLSGDIVRLSADLSHFELWPSGPAPVIGLAVDSENHLWAATEADIMRLSLSDAWSLIDRSNGLRGPVTHAAKYQGRLFVSTSVGLFGAVREATGGLRFELVALPQTEVNHLAATPVGLMMAAREGIYLWRDQQLLPVVTDLLSWRLFASRVIAGRIYAIEDAGLLALDLDGDSYRVSQRFSDPSYRFDEIAESADGSLWIDRLLADPMHFAMQADGRTLAAPESLALGADRAPDSNAAVLEVDGQALVSTDQALLSWNGTEFAPVHDHPLLQAGLAPSSELRTRTCGDGSVFAFTTHRLFRRDAKPSDGFVELQPMAGGTRGIVDVQCTDADGLAWIGTWSGMVRFDPAAQRAELAREAPVMEAIRLDSDQGQWRWLPLQASAASLPLFRQIRFDYASPLISPALRYQSQLRGYDQAWVDGGTAGSREFSALPPGDYRFEARALDAGGIAGPSMQYAFRVAPRWYQTPWAGLALLGALSILFVLLLRWRSNALERRNQDLETLVSERTDTLAQRSLELELANKRLSELADLDGLTGVANRRKLEFELDSAWSAARASDGHLSLLLIDVDHFKQFNDTYGHALGDERLKSIAERLAGWVGPGELLARYGGEEFVLLMPESTIDVALERADAIRRDARHAGEDGIRSSISIGISERRKHQANDAAQLFEYADLALYRAKNAGRDRVEVYTD